jgi:2,3-bisphosphoglycerate-independent phosphoglycerate mutase
MDRDNRWDRTEKAYRLLTEPSEISELSPVNAIHASYAQEIGDEFLEPLRLAEGLITSGDALVCFNFRPDRVRQLIRALVLPEFDDFARQRQAQLDVVTFTQYEKGLPVAVAFPPESLDGLLGQVVSNSGLRQFRTAETEKYPHVTYFMNGGIEQAFPGEDRHLVPSPRVATYDLSPEMSAGELTESCIAAIKKGIYSLVVINYANPDMVGHTGKMKATTEAITTVDTCVGKLMEATNRMGGTLLITADHGNADEMYELDKKTRQPSQNKDGSFKAKTAHTLNPVPLILFDTVSGGKLLVDGTDVRQWDLRRLREQVGVVLQDNFLFRGTIRENIAATKPEASIEEVASAAALAGAAAASPAPPLGARLGALSGPS